ncbi:hypothetical protein QJQ45_006460 [Haematococcus lacustris]|nr:hypothetical protein QJQ45_006460 [Haematococcus lacustris]
MARKKRRTGVGVPRAVPEDPDSDIVDRDEAAQPVLTEAQRRRKASGEVRAARFRDNAFYARNAKLAHLTGHLPQELWDAFLKRAVRPRVKAISERGVVGSLLLGFLVRGFFTLHAADQLDAQGQPLTYTDTDIPVSAAAIPDLSCRKLFRQLCRGLPGEGSRCRADRAPRPPLKKSVSLAGAKVLLGTEEHQRKFGFRGLGGGHLPTWSKRQCTYVRRMVRGLERSLLRLEVGERVDDDWVEDPANLGRLLRHAVHTTREMEAAMAAWQLGMVPWEQSEPTNLLTRPPRPPTPYSLTPTSKCQARHIYIDTNGIYGLMSDAGMLGVLTEEGVTSLDKFRNGALPDPAKPGPENSKFRSSRVSSADNTPSETLLYTPPESFRWLRPVNSMAKRSQVRGLMCSTSINNITRFYDRDVSAALNIRRCSVGPGPRPTELCYWTNRPAMPKPGQPGQDWVEIPDNPLLRKWQRLMQQ